jgi:hypothetical protein
MPRVSATTEAIFERRRDFFNLRFLRSGRGCDPEAFKRYLARTADPLSALGGESLLIALFDLGLTGLPRGLIGAQEPSPFEVALLSALPMFGAHVVNQSGELLAIVANGYDTVVRELSVGHANNWLHQLAGLASLCTNKLVIMEAGVAIAWRLGLAEARERVLALSLNEAIVRGIFDVPKLNPSSRARFCVKTDRLGPLSWVATLGGFSGFGGTFRRPPRVVSSRDAVFATDGQTSVQIFADAFGARLRSTHIATPAKSEGDAISVSPRGEVQWMSGDDKVTASIEGLIDPSSFAASQGLAAVTLPTSHLVFVLGRREESR